MTAFIIEVKDSGVQAALDALAAKVSNMQPYLHAIGEDIKHRAEARFQTSIGPDGQRWLPNARATIEAYIAKQGGFGKKGINRKGRDLAMNKKPLIGLSQSLMSQFHVDATADQVTVLNSMKYAAIQQFGGLAGKPDKNGKRVSIPARPFLPIHEDGTLYPEDRAKILDALNAYLMVR
ncbi:MAG TPA: phage virion morphogenesis protein [Accumulibacter sp.]|uniref:phage virion morphogenesis protein n=1 Tax=Accumulibacter sp. TaxID=2053492 RepID=UPI0025DFB053|nr:phage virion morphogenesis protein [Accumulibacter sp.]MCM8599956.1 phage virion morphogenesis protein [Accumulibacter sp.]MCM8664140.1 phage virion morphogenesis protein [Accumulibacter sp.]HNC51204.1 phage virion morphogenesis protein [Accumulibacter sp.]